MEYRRRVVFFIWKVSLENLIREMMTKFGSPAEPERVFSKIERNITSIRAFITNKRQTSRVPASDG